MGAEEAFVTYVRNGHLDQIHALPSALAAVLAQLNLQEVARPADIARVLSPGADDVDVDQSHLRTRVLGELEEIVQQISRFLRVQGLADGTTISLHGLYAPWIDVDPLQGVASVRSIPRTPVATRVALGILDELRAAPEGVLAGKGPGFYRAAANWAGLLGEVRRPAIVCGALLALMILAAVTTYGLRTAALLRQIDHTGQELQALIDKRAGAKVPESARPSVLQQQLKTLREQARTAARGPAVPYANLGTFSDVSIQVAAVPGVTVESLQVNGSQVAMTGQTPTFQAVEILKDKLGALPRFRGRTVRLTYQRAGQGLTYRVTVQ